MNNQDRLFNFNKVSKLNNTIKNEREKEIMKLNEKYNLFLDFILKNENEDFIKEQVQIQTNPKCGRYSIEDEIWNLAYSANIEVYDFCKWLEDTKNFEFDILQGGKNMKIDDVTDFDSFEDALVEYANSIEEKRRFEAMDQKMYFEYLKEKGPRNRSMKEEAEYMALKLHFANEDNN